MPLRATEISIERLYQIKCQFNLMDVAIVDMAGATISQPQPPNQPMNQTNEQTNNQTTKQPNDNQLINHDMFHDYF